MSRPKKIKPPNNKHFEQGQKWAATQGDPRFQYLAGLKRRAPLRVLDLCGDDTDNCTFLGLKPHAKLPVVVKHGKHVCAVEVSKVHKSERDADCGILPSGEAMYIAQPHSALDLDRIRTCDHEWVVFSTALQKVWLMVQCATCGAHGSVNDPTCEEWESAFYAPSEPYLWTNKSRVTIRGLAPVRYVKRVSVPEIKQK